MPENSVPVCPQVQARRQGRGSGCLWPGSGSDLREITGCGFWSDLWVKMKPAPTFEKKSRIRIRPYLIKFSFSFFRRKSHSHWYLILMIALICSPNSTLHKHVIKFHSKGWRSPWSKNPGMVLMVWSGPTQHRIMVGSGVGGIPRKRQNILTYREVIWIARVKLSTR